MDNLPFDIEIKYLLLLNINDITNYFFVNKRSYGLSKSIYLWYQLAKRDFFVTNDEFFGSQITIKEGKKRYFKFKLCNNYMSEALLGDYGFINYSIRNHKEYNIITLSLMGYSISYPEIFKNTYDNLVTKIKNYESRSLLDFLFYNDKVDLIYYIINHKHRKNSLPLCLRLAAKYGNINIIKYVINILLKGESVNIDFLDLFIIGINNLDTVKFLIEEQNLDVTICYSYSDRCNNPETFKYLITKGMNLKSSLSYLCSLDKSEMIERLLKDDFIISLINHDILTTCLRCATKPERTISFNVINIISNMLLQKYL